MAIFREYLADWEFDERWRGFVARLAEIARWLLKQHRRWVSELLETPWA